MKTRRMITLWVTEELVSKVDEKRLTSRSGKISRSELIRRLLALYAEGGLT